MNESNTQPYPDERIIAYLEGTILPEQQAELEAWISADVAHKRYFYEMTEVWLATDVFSGKENDPRPVYAHLKKRIEKSGFKEKRPAPRIRLLFRRVAAVWIAAVAIVAAYYAGQQQADMLPLLAKQSVEVPAGSRTRVVLPDGTAVWLNAGSRLTYAAVFALRERNVRLEGEGYFEVTPDRMHPFVVAAGGINVRVLGTKFNVKAYDDEKNIEVALAEGSVCFTDTEQPDVSVLMKPEEQLIYNKTTGAIQRSKIPASQAGNWIEGYRFFNELRLEQIASRLEKAYGVTFVFKDARKKTLTFYGDFRPEDTLDDILSVLASSGKFRYKHVQSTVEIE